MTPRPRIGNRKFGLTIAAVFALISAYGWWRHGAPATWAVGVSGTFLVLGLLAPGVLLPVNRLWMGVAHRIGMTINYLVLGVVLYGVLTPVGLVLRSVRKRSMREKFDPAATTYLQPVPRQTTAETLRDWF